MKRWVAYLLAGAMVTSSTTAWAGNYKDVGGHWAENAIATWTERNVLNGYNEMLIEARQIALGRMADDATRLGANAVVGVRLMSSAVMAGAAEMVAYGTAVVVR